MRILQCRIPIALLLLWCATGGVTRAFTAVSASAVSSASASPATVPTSLPSLLPDLTAENYPRVDGSTSTVPISQLLASRVAGLMGEWRRVPPLYSRLESMVFGFPVEAESGQIGRYQQIMARNPHQGTHKSYLSLINAQADLILVARLPSPDETKAAQDKNVKLQVQPVAMDALVFLVNRANPVASLTLDQLRGLFGGKIKMWREVGGKDFPARIFTRERNSGSYELMESLLMQGRPSAPAQSMTLLTEMGEVIQRVAANPHGIGYSVYYYEHFMAPNPGNKVLAIEGVTPTAASISDGRYPLTAPVYAVIRQDTPANAPAARLRDWLLSEDGRRLIAASGYVPRTQP